MAQSATVGKFKTHGFRPGEIPRLHLKQSAMQKMFNCVRYFWCLQLIVNMFIL